MFHFCYPLLCQQGTAQMPEDLFVLKTYGTRLKAWMDSSGHGGRTLPDFEDGATNMVLHLRYLRTKLRNWSKQTVGHVILRKTAITNQINDLDLLEASRTLTDTERMERTSLKIQLDSLLQQEELS